MPTKIQPPVAGREPKRTPIHTTELIDDYAWLRDKGTERVTQYLEAENAYTAAEMSGTEALQGELYEEILSHIKEDDISVPYRDGKWEYVTRTEKGKQYARYCRRPVQADGTTDEQTEATMLDVNELAEGQPFMSLGDISLSPDGNLLAFSTDNTGFRQYTLAIKDLRTGAMLPDRAERVGSIVWAADSATLFYSTEDEQTKRQDRVFRHTVGAPEGTATEVFHEPDERFNLGLGRTRDRKYLVLAAGSHTTSEAWFIEASKPESSFRLLAPRIDDEEYDFDHRDGFFYIRTNNNAERYKLVRTPVDKTDRENWQEVLAESAEASLEDFDLFSRFFVTSSRERGLPVLRVHHFDTNGLPKADADPILFPDPAYTAYGEINRDFNTETYRYSYQSLVRPASVYRYDVVSKQSTLLKQQEVPGGFDASRYESKRLWFKTADGTEVPVSLVFRTDKFQTSKSPLYVYGYGSYGYPLPLGFSAARLALLDRGVVVVYAHIRGGGELGDPWHDGGKMMTKRNTFTDFIEAVEFLTSEGYGDPKRVAIEGGSAGGLLMGAVTNMRPDLFRAVLSHVPFVDVMNTMLDASLPLTVAEYEEWGNPNESEAFAYMRSYSPYENLDDLAGKPLPAILVKTSLNDSQVMYWEPAKYVAKLRTLKTDESALLLHINMDAGHGGASGRYDYLKEIAFDDAFLLRELGVQ
ncbi:MAG: S9 family peptidase [Acidobacteriaceae bacterium]|nr:S9 family peptidase [Acidobacteriaceae bacterium]